MGSSVVMTNSDKLTCKLYWIYDEYCCTLRPVISISSPSKWSTHWPLGDLSEVLEIAKLYLVIGGWGISNETALRWIPQDLTDEKSTLVQVTVWCSPATSHYLSQCWPRSMSPNGVTRPQWLKHWKCWSYTKYMCQFFIIVTTNWQACNGARPSAGKGLTSKLAMILFLVPLITDHFKYNFLDLPTVIQTDQSY